MEKKLSEGKLAGGKQIGELINWTDTLLYNNINWIRMIIHTHTDTTMVYIIAAFSHFRDIFSSLTDIRMYCRRTDHVAVVHSKLWYYHFVSYSDSQP